MNKEKLRDETFLGIVVDNNDPKKLGRCKIRVFQVFDGFDPADIPWASPWKDLNGSEFMLPEIGKYVSVVFDQGNKYSPEYIYAQNFNINLEKKLATLNGEDYTSMRAIMFDHSTQIYRNKTEGLKIDHEYSNINLDQWGNVCVNIRDNKSVITLGSRDAEEAAVLGSTFMTWMDKLVEALLGSQGPAYLDSNGAPVIIGPVLAEALMSYPQLRNNRFLSKHVRISRNQAILAQQREYINQRGDGEQAKILAATPQPESVIVDEESGQSTLHEAVIPTQGNPAATKPDEVKATVEDEETQGVGEYTAAGWPANVKNGLIPSEIRAPSAWLNGTKTGKWINSLLKGTDAAKLHPQAAKAFDAFLDAYEAAKFDGKAVLNISSGYRTLAQQQALAGKSSNSGGYAAKAGNSPHGWGKAVDFGGWASPVDNIKKNLQRRHSCYRHPVYQWMFANSYKWGIYSPDRLRKGWGADEYWHWEFEGQHGPPKPQIPLYSQPFTYEDYLNFAACNLSTYTLPEAIRKQRDIELEKKRAQAKRS